MPETITWEQLKTVHDEFIDGYRQFKQNIIDSLKKVLDEK